MSETVIDLSEYENKNKSEADSNYEKSSLYSKTYSTSSLTQQSREFTDDDKSIKTSDNISIQHIGDPMTNLDSKQSKPTVFELQPASHPDSFCSGSITWHNAALRHFQTFSCLFTAVCLYLAPYQYFFSNSKAVFYVNTVADMVYLLVMLFRSRTSHMVDGVEERNLLKIRNRYQTSTAFILDLITYFPVLQLKIEFIRDDEDFYYLNRQTMFIRLHYILYYLRKYASKVLLFFILCMS